MDININKLKPRKDIDALQDEFDQVKKNNAVPPAPETTVGNNVNENKDTSVHMHILYMTYI